MAGFTYRYRQSGGAPTVQRLLTAITGTLTKGDLLQLTAGEVEVAASGGTTMLGVCLETKATTDGVTFVDVITDSDAVYGAVDANARVIGATLDLTGTTGAMAIAASSDVDLQVVADSTAAEETLVRFAVGKHVYD